MSYQTSNFLTLARWPRCLAALIFPAVTCGAIAESNDGFFSNGVTSDSERAADARTTEGKATHARVSAAPKTPAVKTITNFTQSLRCMDELFLANGKQGIVITSGGIPDATGKAHAGDKEMMISALSKMTMKSGAFEFIDLTNGGSGEGDLAKLFELKGGNIPKIPDYYIRGAVTQLDDNAVRENKGAGVALPFLDMGYSKDQSFDVISMDMSVGDAATRRILPETNTSNTMIITKGGRSGEAGGKVVKMGLSFNKDLSRSEGVGATYRTLIELGLIETLGKFTRVPYWKCLDIESTNPELIDQVREWYDVATDKERILFIQRKLAGMSRFKGTLDGIMTDVLKDSISEYQAYVGLIADGKVNFDLYFSLKDDIQNQLAAIPVTPPAALPTEPRAQNTIPVLSTPSPNANVANTVNTAPASSTPFKMNLTSDRGNNPSYKVGELLGLTLSLNHLGFASCFYQDIGKNTARIFPNRFHRNAMLPGQLPVTLPSNGFKIKFDSPGRERVACIGSDKELLMPTDLVNVNDLSKIPSHSLDDVITQFKSLNPDMTANVVDITIR